MCYIILRNSILYVILCYTRANTFRRFGLAKVTKNQGPSVLGSLVGLGVLVLSHESSLLENGMVQERWCKNQPFCRGDDGKKMGDLPVCLSGLISSNLSYPICIHELHKCQKIWDAPSIYRRLHGQDDDNPLEFPGVPHDFPTADMKLVNGASHSLQ